MLADSSPPAGTILVAEDEPELRQLYEIWLRDRWAVRLASDGQEAFERFDEEVSAAILDQRMPKASGQEVADRIRDESTCPIAMISADVPSVSILFSPLDAYLCKPVTRETVSRTVDRLVALGTFDACVREYFALTSKLQTLRSEAGISAIEREPEYQRAKERVETLSTHAGEAIAELDDPNPALESLVREFTR
ncbi:MAG: response regulator [Halobacteriota archaeon]